MERPEYDAFTAELTRSAAMRDEVIGLVAVGSMAEGADEWSDHDFFLITKPGSQQALRDDLSWLPEREGIALAYQETDHGLQVVYEDGHLLEFAVFDLEEIGLTSLNRRRVLLDRGGVTERVEEVAAREPTRRDDEHVFAKLVTLVLVAEGRTRRGEVLSGRHLGGLARERLLVLLGSADVLDPHRRFEPAQPELAAEVAAATPLGLLEIAERELRRERPELPWHAVDVVRRRLA